MGAVIGLSVAGPGEATCEVVDWAGEAVGAVGVDVGGLVIVVVAGRVVRREYSLATSYDFSPLCGMPWIRHKPISVDLRAVSRSTVRRSAIS